MALLPLGCSLPVLIKGRAMGYDLAPSAPNLSLASQPRPAIYPVANAQRQLPQYNCHPSALTHISPSPHLPPCHLHYPVGK